MRKFQFTFLLLLVFIFITGCGDKEATIQAEKLEYKTNLENLVADIISDSAKAEDIINIYLKAWNTAIKDDIDKNVLMKLFHLTENDISAMLYKKLLKPERIGRYEYYVFKGDINKAIDIAKILIKREDENIFSYLDENRNLISTRIRELNNPPEEYSKAYEVAFELYSLYEEYVSLALSPSGSFASFSDDTGNLSSEIVKKVKEFQARMPIEQDTT